MFGPLSKLFLLLFVVCIIGYLIVFSALTAGMLTLVPGVGTSLSILLMPLGFGAGVFFILFIVMLVLHR